MRMKANTNTNTKAIEDVVEAPEQVKTTVLVLIGAGKTEWNGQDRIQGNADLPLSAEGEKQVNSLIDQLRELNIEFIYSCPTGPSAQTAKLIAKGLKIKRRSDHDLTEVSLGLWQGMPLADLKQKHPKVYKQWLEQPEIVVPPEGESLKNARDRLKGSLEKIIKRNPGRCIAVVLGDISLAVTRQGRENWEMAEIWQRMKEPLTWHRYEIT